MQSTVVFLLVSLVVSCHGSPYGPKSYGPPPPVKVIKQHAPIFRHEIPVVAPLPVVRHVAPVVHALPAPLSAPLPIVHHLPTVHALPAPLPVVHALPSPVAVPSPIFSKFHSQDELGQASFGHVTADQSASNFRDAMGNQVGHYSYINPDGQEVVVHYTAGKGGFRVLSNFLPQGPLAGAGPVLVGPAPVADTPEVTEAKLAHFAAVAEAKAREGLTIGAVSVGPAVVVDTPEVNEAKIAHFAAVAEAKARNAALSRKRRSPYGGSYSAPAKVVKHVAPIPVRHVAPVVHALPAPLPIVHAPLPVVHALPAPLPAPLPIVHHLPTVHALPAPLPVVHHAAPIAVPSPIFSKFHSQDELGQASFGHVTADQSASNFRDAMGNQVGHYSYINPDGQEVVVHYTAGKGGFRVLSNFLPQGPLAGAGPVLVGPAPVADTPEVTEAKLAHFAAVAEAKARNL